MKITNSIKIEISKEEVKTILKEYLKLEENTEIILKISRTNLGKNPSNFIVPDLNDFNHNNGWVSKQDFLEQLAEVNDKAISTIYRYFKQIEKNYEIEKINKEVYIKERN